MRLVKVRMIADSGQMPSGRGIQQAHLLGAHQATSNLDIDKLDTSFRTSQEVQECFPI